MILSVIVSSEETHKRANSNVSSTHKKNIIHLNEGINSNINVSLVNVVLEKAHVILLITIQ